MDAREPTRTRAHGRKVTRPASPAERIAAVRRIVESASFAKIDGTMIDTFTAGAIVAVYDALSEPAREHFAGFPAGRMGLIAFKLMNKAAPR